MSASLSSGVGLGEKVVDAGLGGDRGGGDRIVAGHHDGADAHCAHCGEALLDARLHDVLKMDDAEQRPSSATASGVPPDIATRSTDWRNSSGVRSIGSLR